MDDKKELVAARRSFLKLACVSAPAAVTTAFVTESASAAKVEASEGLRDTAHTRAYFESARF